MISNGFETDLSCFVFPWLNLSSLTLRIIPKAIHVTHAADPPLLNNGRVCPVTGKILRATPILIKLSLRPLILAPISLKRVVVSGQQLA